MNRSMRLARTAIATAGALAVVASGAPATSAPSAPVRFPGTNGRIVFSETDGTQYDLYTINPDGGGRSRLTDNTGDDFYPAFSAKAKWIVYAGFDGNDREIYLIKANGGGRRQLTDNTTFDSDPAWSPSGKRIVYYADDGTDDELYTVKTDGGGRRQLTDNSADDYDPVYSPSGASIAYVSSDATQSDIFTMNTMSLRIHGESGPAIHGKCQPPKKRTTIRKLCVVMWTYSPRKKKASFMPLYSV